MLFCWQIWIHLCILFKCICHFDMIEKFIFLFIHYYCVYEAHLQYNDKISSLNLSLYFILVYYSIVVKFERVWNIRLNSNLSGCQVQMKTGNINYLSMALACSSSTWKNPVGISIFVVLSNTLNLRREKYERCLSCTNTRT